MARIRTIKPEFWQDEDLAEVSEPALILAAALLNHADDEGYFRANPGLVKAACFPLREPSVSIHAMLTELSIVGYIELKTGQDGRLYGLVPGFARHQKVNRPSPSKIKGLHESGSIHGGFSDASPPEQGTGKGTGKGTGRGRASAPEPDPGAEQTAAQAGDDKRTAARSPTARGTRLSLDSLPVEWEQWARGERPDLEPQQVWRTFRDYWIAKTGKDGTKLDWFATWRNWVRRERKQTARGTGMGGGDHRGGSKLDQWMSEHNDDVIEGEVVNHARIG